MKLKDIVKVFEQFAPFTLQEDYDNSGIQFGEPEAEVSKGLVCIDITEEVLKEAIEKKCDLIISHHPLIFRGIKKLTGSNYIERVLIEAIKKNISIVSVHTNLDIISEGVNLKLARKLGLKDTGILMSKKGVLKKLVTFCPGDHAEKVRSAIFNAGAGHIGEYDCCSYNIEGTGSFRAGENTDPFVGEKGQIHYEPEVRIETVLPAWLEKSVINSMITAHPYEEVAYDIYPLDNNYPKAGAGMIGSLDEPMAEIDFLNHIKEVLGVPFLRHSNFIDRKINRVAICGGSGSFLRDTAMSAGADAFVTADIKYHDFFDVNKKMLMIDAGHYETEQFTKEILYEIVSKKITNFALLISDQSSNPVRYF
jgi:dinuclear metal center YbgI/SA1388 family protein